jgi:hypothetical protein
MGAGGRDENDLRRGVAADSKGARLIIHKARRILVGARDRDVSQLILFPHRVAPALSLLAGDR